MKRFLVILFLFPSLAFATITEWYVNNSGSGTGTGTTEANAMSFATFTDFMIVGGSHTAAAGDRFNVKGTITGRTTNVDIWVNGGSATSPVMIRGYNSTIGDLTSLSRTNGNGPLVTTNYPVITYTTGGVQISGSNIIVEALQISSANVTGGNGTLKTLTGAHVFIKRCDIINSSTNANAAGVTLSIGDSNLIDCDVSLTGGSGGAAAISSTTTANKIIGCRVKGGPSVGITTVNSNVIAFNTIFVSTGIGLAITGVNGNVTVLYNTIVSGGADGINVVTGTTQPNVFIGNMITDNTGDGIDMVSTANPSFASNNRFRDNATTYNNAGDWITATKYDDVTSGAGTSDYVNSAGNNYNLIWTSPGTGAGSPLFADIGALQAPTPTATPSASATATASATNTPTPTPSATFTPTITPCAPTPTATATWTPTPTFTPTSTPTATATATNTPTPTATATSTPTPTPTPSATSTPTATACAGGGEVSYNHSD